MATKVKVKEWGNSLGIIVPSDIAKAEEIESGDEILIDIKKNNPIGEIFGMLKGSKINSQKFKDNIRKEEYEAEKRKWKNIS